MDKKKIEQAVRTILREIDPEPDRTDLEETPARVARMYEEIFAGTRQNPAKIIKVFTAKDYDEIIIIRDIPLYSMCEHHLMPFIGKAHVAYVPKDGRVTGLSKMVRVVQAFARRLQVQERLTHQIARTLMDSLKPQGVLVIIEAEHLCMSMRGVKESGTLTVTSAVLGIFRSNKATRQEAIELLKKHDR